MARTAGGVTDMEWVRERVAKARSADELRQAQAILLPLELGLSLEQTAVALGPRIALSTLYRVLARHGWRKLAPDTAHPKGDPLQRDAFKKTRRRFGA